MVKKIFLIFLPLLLILLFSAGVYCGNYITRGYFSPLASHAGRTNFLFVGMNGGSAAGDDLTDTMIFASLNQNSGKATMISIPRDIWIPGMEAKVNASYHYGGNDLMKKNLEEILGQKIDYVAVLSFDGFKKVIDALGGVEVNVVNSFDDYQYPIAGKENDLCGGDKTFSCRYEHLHFDAGLQKMNGETALKYVRSRHAEGDEGTDFARSQRQEQLLKSIKKTVVDAKLYLHPREALKVIKALKEAVKTDISVNQYGMLLSLASKIDWNKIVSDSVNENLLVNPKYHYSKQWVLLPKAKDWAEVHQFVEEKLE